MIFAEVSFRVRCMELLRRERSFRIVRVNIYRRRTHLRRRLCYVLLILDWYAFPFVCCGMMILGWPMGWLIGPRACFAVARFTPTHCRTVRDLQIVSSSSSPVFARGRGGRICLVVQIKPRKTHAVLQRRSRRFCTRGGGPIRQHELAVDHIKMRT